MNSIVIWGGDVNLGRRQHYRTAELGVEKVLGGIPALADAHLRMVNLECVVAVTGEQGVKGSRKGPYYYRARPEMLRVLTAAGIDMVATANNHSGDYGHEALLEQGRRLDALGMGHTGSGPNLEAALTPVIRRAGDLNVALFALDATEPRFAATAHTPGNAYLDLSDTEAWRKIMTPRIAAARRQAHVVLTAVHWGRNNVTEPDELKIAAGRALIDAGADAVLGTNAHWLQGVDIYRGRPIIHDAGDLLFDSVRKTLRDGGLFRLELSTGGVERVEFIPIGVGFGFSVQYFQDKALRRVRRFAAQCAALGTELIETPHHTGIISLQPAPRNPVVNAVAPTTLYHLGTLTSSDGDENARMGAVDEVPPEARMEPVRLGPLTLLGVTVRPRKITRRRMLWVETFWTTDTHLEEDIRLDIRALPIYPVSMPVWGKSMDHDPCDWMVPTRRWCPGTIYRDFYGLRPPRKSRLVNVNLQIAIGIVSEKYGDAPEWFGPEIPMAIPGLETYPDLDGPLLYRTVFPSLIDDCLPGRTWTARQLQAVTGGTWLVEPPESWYVRSVAYQRTFIHRLPGPFMFVADDSVQRQRHAQSTHKKKAYDRHADLPRICRHLAGAMVSKPVDNLPPDFPLLQVDDPVRSLIELGLAARQRFKGHVIAITGTAGKSTTVGMLKTMLGGDERILSSMNNYNMRIDVPALPASLNPEHEAVIIEVAQSALWMKRGPVTRLIRPTIALITEIGISQGDLGVRSIQDTIRWKSRIFDGLSGAAIAVIGEHLEGFEDVHARAAKHARRIIVFGRSTAAELRIIDVQADDRGSWITLRTPREQVCWYVPVPGPGMVHNAVAAAAVVYAMGRDLSAATEALKNYTPNEGCLQSLRLVVRGRPVHIIDDSWNSTVSSMRNAFEVLAQHTPTGKGRKIAVLGRMVHLGDLARELHEKLAEPLLATGVHQVITHGAEMHWLRARLPQELLGPHFQDAPSAVHHLLETDRAGDLILVKGSRRNSDFGDIVTLLRKKAETKTMEETTDIPTKTELGPFPTMKIPVGYPGNAEPQLGRVFKWEACRQPAKDMHGQSLAELGLGVPGRGLFPGGGASRECLFSEVASPDRWNTSNPPPPSPETVGTSKLIERIHSLGENDYEHSSWHGIGSKMTEALLEDAALRRGARLRLLDRGYYEVALENTTVVFRRNSPDHSVLASTVTADKHRTRKLLALHDIPTPAGARFTTFEGALGFFSSRSRPVCVKPNRASRGRGVTPRVENSKELKAAWRLARRFDHGIIVQDSFEGYNLRVLVSNGRAVGAFICLPAAVVGNGRETIRTLIDAKNACRRSNPWLSLWPVERFDIPERAGRSLDDVPAHEERVHLTAVAGITSGSDTIEATGDIHPSLLELAERAVGIFPGLHLACVSLMCLDVTQPVRENSVVVLDMDAKPAVADLVFPTWGRPMTEMADRVLDDALTHAGHYAMCNFSMVRLPTPSASLFLVPKLQLGNAVALEAPASSLCGVRRLHLDSLSGSRGTFEQDNKVGAGAAGQVCSQAEAWEQESCTSCGHSPANPDRLPEIEPAGAFSPSCGGKAFAEDSTIQVELLRQAAHARNLEVQNLSSTITRVTHDGRTVVFYKGMSHGTRIVARRATNSSKDWTKRLLRNAGIETPFWKTFWTEQKEEARQWVASIEFPVVIKPGNGSWGRGVSSPVLDAGDFERAWENSVETGTEGILAEEYIQGRVYRLFVVGYGVIAAAEILPAYLTGDGIHTLEQLTAMKNRHRESNPSLAICPVVLTDAILENLKKQGLHEQSVLEAGRHLQLHTAANIGTGGESRDVTHLVHPKFAPIAVLARKAVFDPPHVGIDLIAEDIGRPPEEQRWSIIEVNTNPDMDLHHFPSFGMARDVAGAVMDHFFPDHRAWGMLLDRARVSIQGRVQGVGFRRWLWKEAHLHTLRGWVRNVEDGTVEAVFAGMPRAVQHMIAACRVGPKRAVVEKVFVTPFTEDIPMGFEISKKP